MPTQITLDSRFMYLHDTPMAELLREQEEASALFSLLVRATGEKALPFHFLPSFSPTPVEKPTERLILEEVTESKGWLIRRFKTETGETGVSPGISMPLYPPLPSGSYVVLGYAGEFANKMMVELAGQAKKTRYPPFSFAVWYCSNVRLTFTYEKGVFYKTDFALSQREWRRVAEGTAHNPVENNREKRSTNR